jgi:hypothetical protein
LRERLGVALVESAVGDLGDLLQQVFVDAATLNVDLGRPSSVVLSPIVMWTPRLSRLGEAREEPDVFSLSRAARRTAEDDLRSGIVSRADASIVSFFPRSRRG